MCWNPKYVILIIISTLIDYYSGIQIGKHKDQRVKRLFLLLSLFSNLGLLFFFKYYNFLTDSLNFVFHEFNIFYDIPYFNILLPVGISFYTFQTLSYTIDVYRGVKTPEKNLGIFAVYVSFFPQLVAGPIERSTRLIPQFHKINRFKYENISKGIKMIIWGYFLKLVIADRAAIYVNAVYNHPHQHSGITFIAATILFAFQVYGDFAGYSSIAIGSAKIMGYDLMTNFNRPFFASTIGELWKRWHISLASWFRDYVYIPLGGNRVVKWRWYYNLIVTFVLSGLWHGAAWTYVIWGTLHGLFLIFTILIQRNLLKKIVNDRNKLFFKISGIIITNILFWFSQIFFRANSVSDSFYITKKVFTSVGRLFIPEGAGVTAPVYSLFAIILLMSWEFKKEFFNDTFSLFENKRGLVRITMYALLISIIIYIGVFDGGQFIYFQF
jgi:D-alanyl-lipoteichoic acid acyltransferase DltB (MBOAT superfamily)